MRAGFTITGLAVIMLCASGSFSLEGAAYQQEKQPQDNKPPKRRVVTYSTEDIIPASGRVSGSSEPKSEAATESEEASGKKSTGEADATGKAGSQPDNASPEERAWREALVGARKRVKELERETEEIELAIADLQNELTNVNQTANSGLETVKRLELASRQLNEMREELRTAREQLSKLEEQGRDSDFKEAPGPSSKDKQGNPNADYYKQKYNSLVEELETAERRVRLYENRARELNRQIQTSVGGPQGTGLDNFTLARMQREFEEAIRELERAITSVNSIRSRMERLQEDARQAGLPPGIFRQ